MNRIKLFIIFLSCYQVLSLDTSSNTISDSRSISSGDELVSTVVDDCFDGETPAMRCIRLHALSYLDTVAGGDEGKRSRSLDVEHADDDKLDKIIMSRIKRYLKNKEFKLHLPEGFLQQAILTFRPSKGFADFDVSFPPAPQNEARSITEGGREGGNSTPEQAQTTNTTTNNNTTREMMKDKMLLPLLLLLKLKLKALVPIMLTMIGIKAVKALVLSKIALALVVGFLVVQLCKKGGMMMPLLAGLETGSPAPAPLYGPPTTPSTYDPSGWEPSQGGPYARVWDAQQMAYNAYVSNNQDAQQQQQQTVQ